MNISDRLCWSVIALVHLLPATALFRPAVITSLYKLTPQSPLFALIHHRAALFVIVVVASIWAMVEPGTQKLASITVAISMVSFLTIYWSNGSPPALRTIALTDLAAAPFLAFVTWRIWYP